MGSEMCIRDRLFRVAAFVAFGCRCLRQGTLHCAVSRFVRFQRSQRKLQNTTTTSPLRVLLLPSHVEQSIGSSAEVPTKFKSLRRLTKRQSERLHFAQKLPTDTRLCKFVFCANSLITPPLIRQTIYIEYIYIYELFSSQNGFTPPDHNRLSREKRKHQATQTISIVPGHARAGAGRDGRIHPLCTPVHVLTEKSGAETPQPGRFRHGSLPH